MSVRYPREWEKVCSSTRRLKIYGGWLVHSSDIIQRDSDAMSESMVFVPDTAHVWHLSEAIAKAQGK